MTRDEAKTIIHKAFDYDRADLLTPESLLGCFVQLGLLKLEEPDIDEGVGQIFKISKFMSYFNLDHRTPAQLISALDRAGLEIREKS
ncbi:hypothetical protein [Bradyrhizobium sp. Tv2a-2]|uniref:hypothetical protein n=1 Tax=Bradyrhizobium sp. Tv2a-2 TaxID=113395 RepID=UPI000413C52B|nr:hypothetical protein [Bradyrhizobium sp. Tv2a-2]